MSIPEVDLDYLLYHLTGLLNTPSPTGMASGGIEYCEKIFSMYPDLELKKNRKGALLARWQGMVDSPPRSLTAHVDTLGAMVREIKPNGRLKLTQLGGYDWSSIETEGCTIFTAGGRKVRGSLLYNKASVHVHGRIGSDQGIRDENSMEIRIDERTCSSETTRGLGIEVGDFVALDPRVVVSNGFVRSRHLDDKAGVACIAAAVKSIHAAGLRPARTTYIFISNYEEVGHGAAAGIPPETDELLTVDMAAVGEGQNSDEYHCTLCIKDSGGPYHHEFNQRLRQLASRNSIEIKVDTYPVYGSDGEAFWKAGGDIQVALIGPGVDSSHNYERTHCEALLATTRLITAYLLE